MTTGNTRIKLPVKTGDQVVVIAGANKGKTGTVVRVFRDTQRVSG